MSFLLCGLVYLCPLFDKWTNQETTAMSSSNFLVRDIERYGQRWRENYLNLSLSVDGLANKLNYLFTLCEC